MIKALFLFFVIAGFAFLAAWAADHPGGLIIHWQNWEIETSLALGVVALAVLLIFVLIVTRIVGGVRAAPGSVSQLFQRRLQTKDLEAISKGLIAAAAGDASLARKYALSARGREGNLALARLLGAQAAQLSGDEAEAERCFQAMLEAPETKILGLRGLLAHATRRGDAHGALEYAKQAFSVQPKTLWAFQALFDLQTEDGRWRDALATLESGAKSGLIPMEAASKSQAVLLTARAGQKLAEGDAQEAERLSVKAFRLLPSFTPAALLAARLYKDNDNAWKAAGILEEAWRASPHPALVEAYSALEEHETAHARAKRLSGLADMKPDDSESRLLLARQAINTRDWEGARRALAPLVEQAPTARVCALMGEIEQEEHGDVGAAREWLARAVSAPPEPDWARERFDFKAADWARLAKDLAAPGAPWPPRMDPALFARSGAAPGPFADIVRNQEGEGAARPAAPYDPGRLPAVLDDIAVEPATGNTARRRTDPPRDLRSKPGRSPGGEQTPLRSAPSDRRAAPQTRPYLPAKRPPRKSIKLGFNARAASADQEAPQDSKKTRPRTGPIYHGMAADVPPPPDDPGPDFDGEA